MNIKVRKSYLLIMVLILLSGVFTVTLAYFGVFVEGLDNPSTELFTTGQFDITLSDSSVQIENLKPALEEYITNSSDFNKEFTLTNGSTSITSNINVCSRIYLDFDMLDPELISSDVRYMIIDETDNIRYSGNFSTANVSDDFIILNNTFIEAGETKNYRLYIWLEFDDQVSQNHMLNKRLSARLIVKSYDSRTEGQCGSLADIASGSVKIHGLNKIGQVLSAVITQTKPESIFTYQWYYNNTPTIRDGTVIQGATNSTFVVPMELSNKYIYVVATASLAGYNDKIVTDITDSVNNSSEVVLDGVSPIITLAQNSDSTYAITRSVNVNVTDATGLLGNQSFDYGWSTSSSVAPESFITVNPIYTEGDTSINFTVSSPSGLTGNYYLWVKPTDSVCDYIDHLEENSNNNCNSNTIKTTGTFAFDNTAPTCTITGVYADGYLNTTINASDDHSGIALTNGYGFKHDSQTNYTVADNNAYGFPVDSEEIYYIYGYVEDAVGNYYECDNVVETSFSLATTIINSNKACVDGSDNVVCGDDIESEYVTDNVGIDFSSISSLTNGQGLYRDNQLGDGTNYYFRGGSFCAYTNYLNEVQSGTRCKASSVGGTWVNSRQFYHCSLSLDQSLCESKGFDWYELNNNVMFAGYAWKIIRLEEVNDAGETKYYTHLLYNGPATNSVGTNAYISLTSWYDLNYYIDSEAMFAGYMYNTDYIDLNGASSSIAEAQDNAGNSVIKTVLEAWFAGEDTIGGECDWSDCTFGELYPNLTDYSSKIANRVFCNDREVIGGLGYGIDDYTLFAGNDRISGFYPSFSCTQPGDKFTLSVTNGGVNGFGNNTTTFPIGLITADELSYAGIITGRSNFTNYAHSGSNYWTMTPNELDSGITYSFYLSNISKIASGSVDNTFGLRPVIVLKDNVKAVSGTGSLADPYMVSTN